MRKDMAKVIVERERYGLRIKTPKGRMRHNAMRDYEDEQDRLESLPRVESMGKQWIRDYRMLNENLNPLYRFLDSCVGRPWDKVHSEICEYVKLDSAVQKHILDHVKFRVNENVEINSRGQVISHNGDYGNFTQLNRGDLFVCPRTGLLRKVSKRQGRVSRSRREKNDNRVELNDGNQLHKIDGIWYYVELGELTLQKKIINIPIGNHSFQRTEQEIVGLGHHHTTRDAVLKKSAIIAGIADLLRVYGKSGVWGKSKRALSHKELKQHKLSNDDQDQRKSA